MKKFSIEIGEMSYFGNGGRPKLFSKPRVRSNSFSLQSRHGSIRHSRTDDELFASESCEQLYTFHG